jgi:hypothetical protein
MAGQQLAALSCPDFSIRKLVRKIRQKICNEIFTVISMASKAVPIYLHQLTSLLLFRTITGGLSIFHIHVCVCW